MPKTKVCPRDATHVTSEPTAARCAICEAELVEVGQPSAGGHKVEFVFVIDGTGSMSGEISYVKENLTYLADLLRANQHDPKLGMVVFRDFDYDGDKALETFELSHDAAAFAERVKNIAAQGGGDAPEHALDGLLQACRLFQDADAKRCMMLITDAPTKPARDGQDTKGVAGVLRQHRVLLQAVVGNKDDWKDLTLNPRTYVYDLASRDRHAMDDTLSRIVGTIVKA